jgi:hypothetical protein
MNNNLIIGLSVMLVFAIVVNYRFYVFYKNSRKLLFNRIGNQKIIKFENVKTKFYLTNGFSSRWNFFAPDIVFFENTLLILTRNYRLGLNQAIVQISKCIDKKKIDGVETVFALEKMEVFENKIRIYSFRKLLVNAKVEITLNFEDRIEDLNFIEKYINEILE